MARLSCAAILVVAVVAIAQVGAEEVRLSRERAVLQTDHGDLHIAFYDDVAPVTAPHIRKLMEMGCYNTNLFFRVDKGFVAQVDAVTRGRLAKLDQWQRVEADKQVPLEVVKEVKHNKRGILSMGRYSDPNTGTSSFSILLGPAPHLDMQYTIFGEVTKGLETLTSMEGVETHREGIFVMPKKRITIHSTYTYVVDEADLPEQHLCSEELGALRSRHAATSTALQKLRQKQLPGS